MKPEKATMKNVNYHVNEHIVGCCGIAELTDWDLYDEDWDTNVEVSWKRLGKAFYSEAAKEWNRIKQDYNVGMLLASTAISDGNSQIIVEKILKNSGWKLVGSERNPKTNNTIKLWLFS